MNAKHEASAAAYAAADALLGEYPIPVADEQRDTLRRLIAMAWLQGWSDAGHEALRLLDAPKAKRS